MYCDGGKITKLFLASQDALEVMLVSESVSQSVTLRTELTDVTLVSEDTLRTDKTLTIGDTMEMMFEVAMGVMNM